MIGNIENLPADWRPFEASDPTVVPGIVKREGVTEPPSAAILAFWAEVLVAWAAKWPDMAPSVDSMAGGLFRFAVHEDCFPNAVPILSEAAAKARVTLIGGDHHVVVTR